MSNFGAKLAELLERRNLRQSDLSRASGIKEAMISRWISGRQNYVSMDDLSTICAAVSSDLHEQAELIRAHLLDERTNTKAGKLIDIRVLSETTGHALHIDTPVYRVPLPPKLQRAFDVLMEESVHDPDVRDVLLGMATILDRDLNVADDVSSAVDAAGKLLAADALGSVGAAAESNPPSGPVRYKVPRRSKKRRPGASGAT